MTVTQLAIPGLASGVRGVRPCPACAGLGTLEATDIFCGAGGSSNGLEWVRCLACGRSLIRVTQAINHDELAVQAHNANFPHTDHDVHDVEEIPASRFRRTDILWVSPDCTHHAYCRGPKDTSPGGRRSRATFKDVVRFTAHHRYDAVIVENVVEARLWCDEPGHREKCSCGRTFDAWFRAMCDLGYDGQIVYFNSQFALVPQSRDRMYVVLWRTGARRPDLDFRPVSWCSNCETVVRGVQAWKAPSRRGVRAQPGMGEWGRYGQQYLYACPACTQPVAPAVMGAKTIIDWRIPMERIGDKPATRCKTCGSHHPVACNTRERVKVGWQNLGRRQPVQVQVGGNLFERSGYARVWAIEDPLRTVTGTPYMALVMPGKAGSTAISPDEPAPTITGRPHAAIVQVGGQTGQARNARATEEPLGAVTTENHRALIARVGGQSPAPHSTGEPMGTVTAHDRQLALIVQNMAHNRGRSVEEPTPPVTTGGNHMLVQAAHGGDTRPPRDLREPTPTVAGHGEVGLVALRRNTTAVSTAEPAQTVSAQGTHHGLLVYNGVPGFVRDLDDAAGTVTGRDKQSLLVPYYTAGLARTVLEPAATVSTKDREALVITDADIDDCLFRMLQWPELLRAQAMHMLPDGSAYRLTARRRDKHGRVRELSNELRVKMIGNAVSSPVATMLGAAVAEAWR